jgi:trimethylamine:corrinoid methyltransferase-like protein
MVTPQAAMPITIKSGMLDQPVAEAGAEDAWQRANREVREVLQRHRPNYLDAGLDTKLRAQFNIRI